MSYRFYFEDTLEPVEWWGSPENKCKAFTSIYSALAALNEESGCEPHQARYLLMTEEQASHLRGKLSLPLRGGGVG